MLYMRLVFFIIIVLLYLLSSIQWCSIDSFNSHITLYTSYNNGAGVNNTNILSQSSYQINVDYLWKRSEEYNLICSKIQKRFQSCQKVLTFKYYPYGLGNLFYSVLAVVAVALAGDYHLYYDYNDYNDYFDGCFSSNILTGNEEMEYDYKCLNHKICMFGLSFNSQHYMFRVSDYLTHDKVLLGGSLMDIEKVLNNTDYSSIWTSLFKGTTISPYLWNIRRVFLRLLLNPEPVLKRKYLEEREKLLVHKYTIGLQLRMGGSLANMNEEYTGVPFNRIDEVIDQVRNISRSKKWENNFQLFISSDSSYVIDVIRNKTLGEFPVVSSHLFKRGHTELESGKDITRGVLVDIYYMSMVDHLIVTWPSSLGRLMCFINKKRGCDAVLNWWEKNKGIDFV